MERTYIRQKRRIVVDIRELHYDLGGRPEAVRPQSATLVRCHNEDLPGGEPRRRVPVQGLREPQAAVVVDLEEFLLLVLDQRVHDVLGRVAILYIRVVGLHLRVTGQL